MKNIHKVDRNELTKEELLPGFTQEFPYIASCVEIDYHIGRIAPWHWHRAVELFYIESGGALEYCTPDKTLIFPAGSGGFVNSNVLHMTRPFAQERNNRQLLHIFDPSLVAGIPGSLIEKKFVLPLVSSSQVDILPLYPDSPESCKILDLIRSSFLLSDQEPDYELKLRSILSEIWFQLLTLARPMLTGSANGSNVSDQLKQMMIYVHEHYAEKITIANLAQQAFLSERACFRLFQDHLRITPMEYINSYRLQISCQMLISTNGAITEVANACGFGSSSYFGKLFRRTFDCSPLEYRRCWQNRTNLGQ